MIPDNPDAKFIVNFILALFLLPIFLRIVVELSSAKRTAAVDVIYIAFGVQGGWEVKILLFTVAGMIMIAIPSWGLLKLLHPGTSR